MSSQKNSSLFIEKYRPIMVKHMILPDELMKFFQNIVNTKEIPNLLLSSSIPGTGKTSIAKALINDLKADYIYINASMENSIDIIRGQIAEFAQTMSFSGGLKIVILDEADGLTPQFQKALRGFMEEFANNCRFIITCNYIAKIIPALRQGRTMVVDFNMEKYRDELIPKIVNRITGILKNENIEYESEDILLKLVKTYFPSIRRIISTIQQYASINGKIDDNIVLSLKNDDELANMIIERKKLSEIRSYIEREGMNYTDVFKLLFETLVPKINKKSNAISIIAEYEYRCGFSTDTTLQIAACIVELFGCID